MDRRGSLFIGWFVRFVRCTSNRCGCRCDALGFRFNLVAGGLFLCEARFFVRRFAGLRLAAARLLSGGKDRNLFLLAALCFTPGSVALLFVKGPLPRGKFGRGKRAPRTGSRPAGGRRDARSWCRTGWRRRRRTRCGGRISRDRGTRLAHFHFDDFRSPVAEALAHGSLRNRPPKSQRPCRP
ncbi:MAG TPA: hypothetical protein VK730_00735, partial [Solirubrobacteraceae bacterium]|nr:hypothetical protein [Solirubrobacteraceae bacterium]